MKNLVYFRAVDYQLNPVISNFNADEKIIPAFISNPNPEFKQEKEYQYDFNSPEEEWINHTFKVLKIESIK